MYEENTPPIIGEQTPPDLDFIMKVVDEAELEGMSPEDILDENELAVYQAATQGNVQRIPYEHYTNLVDFVDKSELGRLGGDVCFWVRSDELTREDWSKREKEGIRLLGVSDKVSGGASFDGASTVVHPLLAKAVTEFQSRAIAEMWPADGPVKSVVLGDKTPDRIAQALRVEDYMNYQYTIDMPGAFEEEDNMFFRLPISGSCFKKTYKDALTNKLCSRLIEPADFIVPFSATDLASAPRYTHRYRESYNSIMKKVANGFYVKPKNLAKPANETFDYPEVKDEIDHTEGKQRVGMDDSNHTILEMYIDLDLPGFEDENAEGEKTEVALPYIVWVERDSQSVLRIQRNWMPEDKLKNAKLNVTHYRFMPGLGFYGYGLLHLIGGLANSATGALRALLDSAAFANMQGGYRTRESRVKGGEKPLSPGEWREVDITAEELSRAFFRVPYSEPSSVLYQLLGYLDGLAKNFTGGDLMSGDANPNAPVGTTLALIEQGGKTFSAIHKRLHVAHKEEFKILARLNYEYLPDNGYPYLTDKGSKQIFAQDFDERIDIIPVSDPSIISNSQRVVQAQAALDLAEKHPDKVDVTGALKVMLQVLRIPNYEELLKPNEAMMAQQQKMAELEIKLKEAEIAKAQAEAEERQAKKTESYLRGLYSSMQAAGMALNPTIAAMGDSIYKSAGGMDFDQAPIANWPTLTQSVPQDVQPAQVHQNTSPGFPANANPEQPAPVAPEQPVPRSSELGAEGGIETARNEPMGKGYAS